MDPESATAGFVIDAHLDAEHCAFMAVELGRQLVANGVGMLCRLQRTNIEDARKLAEIVSLYSFVSTRPSSPV